MLENGLDLRKLQSKKITLRYFMTLGFLSIGAGIGLIVGLTISNFFYNVFHIYKTYNCYSDTYDYSYLAILPSILVFCGISLILSYLFDKKHTKEEESKNIQISE